MDFTATVKASGAYRNRFFDNASTRRVDRQQLATIVREWYPVTQAFCLGLLRYNALLSDLIETAPDVVSRTRIERACLVPVEIAAEEFGMGKHGVDGIHYQMFARLGEPLGISVGELQSHPRGTLPATRSLVDEIRSAFSSMLAGAACVRVVEGTAYNIVEAMDHMFGSATTDDGHRLFDERQMQYISLHLVIEKVHDEMSGSFIEDLVESDEDAEEFQDALVRIAGRFHRFWKAMDDAMCVSLQAT